ncbi:hypothetical protein GR268_44330 [Rhizobium leguminosarum]|nr:hypothetical protein [Rhizobium leguminosarum]NEJ83495.1 hypothetical protein [Rhizobium leguminosarum]
MRAKQASRAEGRSGSLPVVDGFAGLPQITAYGSGGSISSGREVMAAAVTIRQMLGVSPSAYEEACEALGQVGAAIAIACIHERVGQINSAGGYLRDLTAKARRGEFSLGPMLFTQLRAKGGAASTGA